jgi:RNA polymerase-associated protein LEO1
VAEEAIVEEPEPTYVYYLDSNRPKPPASANTDYVDLPVSLVIEHKVYNEDALRSSLEGNVEGMDAVQVIQHEHPWRAIRRRVAYDADGQAVQESNARIVRWEDGSEHLFIGDSVVYQITKQKIRRGVNDVYSMHKEGVATFWSKLDEKLVFKLIREPNLRPNREDKKQRKVKLVGLTYDKDKEDAEADKSRIQARSKLAKVRARKEREASNPELDANFLEEGVEQPDADDDGFIDDSRPKRARSTVNESRLLDAKRRATRRDEDEEDDEDEDQDEDQMGDVVDDDDDDDDTGGGADDGLQLYDD